MSLLKSLEIAEEVGDTLMLPYIYLNMGNIFTNYNDVQKATSLYRKAFRAAASNGNWQTLLDENFSKFTKGSEDAPDINAANPTSTMYPRDYFTTGDATCCRRP